MERTDIEAQLDRLRAIMTGLTPGVIAFSGGVDSRLLACLAKRWDLDFALVTVAGPHLTPREVVFARIWHGWLGLECEVIREDPLDVPEVSANRDDRCYHCKLHIFKTIRQWGRKRERHHLVEGSQLSDQNQYRPGRRALDELGVHSPLADAGFRKEDVRRTLTLLDSAFPQQPSRPCLLTRFAYGLRPERELLARLGVVEDGLAALGLREYRLRVLGTGRYCLQLDEREKGFFKRREQAIKNVIQRGGIEAFEVLFSPGVSGYYDRENGRVQV